MHVEATTLTKDVLKNIYPGNFKIIKQKMDS